MVLIASDWFLSGEDDILRYEDLYSRLGVQLSSEAERLSSYGFIIIYR